METPAFTAREVAVLVEELRAEFRTVSEVIIPLREDMAEVKSDISVLKTDVLYLKDAVRVGFPEINRRLSVLESKLG